MRLFQDRTLKALRQENELARVMSAAPIAQEQRIIRNDKVKESKLSH